MLGFSHWPGQLLALLVLVLEPARTLEFHCPVPDIANGRLQPSQNLTYGSTATVQCDPGYHPTGTATVECMSDGRLYPRVPVCVLGRCSYPPVVRFADRSPQREFPVGTAVTYTCRTGFELVPGVFPVATCLANLTWSAIPNLCQEVQCPRPVVAHGRQTTPRTATYTYGSHVEFQCDRGYVLRGSQRTQCKSDGTWEPPLPYCDKACGPPPRITNGRQLGLRMRQYPYGSEVKYSCLEGLSLVGEESIYCSSSDGVNLEWSGPAPECRVVRCPKPVVERGRVTPEVPLFPYGAAVRFSCDRGFALHGDAQSRCLADGSWQPPLPTCQPVLCPRPGVAHGRLKGPTEGATWYRANATVAFECLHGYHLSADPGRTSAEATCLPDGNWTPLPKCKEDDADVCEEIRGMRRLSECGVPMTELKTLLEAQKLLLEIKKLKVELEELDD